MIKSLLLTVTLLIPISMSAQTAKVQALTPAEAAEAKSLYQQKSDIEKKITDFRDSLVKEYVETKDPKQAANSSTTWYSFGSKGQFYYRAGWDSDSFLFSDDFKYIVPAPSVTSPSLPTICTSGTLCFTGTNTIASPAVGVMNDMVTVPYAGSVLTTDGNLVLTPSGAVCSAPLGSHCQSDGKIVPNSWTSN